MLHERYNNNKSNKISFFQYNKNWNNKFFKKNESNLIKTFIKLKSITVYSSLSK